ncbi:30S ribosome-binding factor RbfA [Aurantimonas coralicida]|uniref:30S ribosome-binding factor RbfA n=1 Tax=Aurantimonas coralicida TaxID=182270 RepID=UPI001E304A96|nr:30S ribosome-binding factor RbfA [Aurantimonas coralicida]MCD1644960.1 30S ribosome-binding factor RbfA [Aurantimonas coralicida]|tara:strand:- start:301 stop:714 length:414 start_codon:yes stop_codon:yes gene_type:complete
MARTSSSGPSQRQLSVGEKVRHALTEVMQRGEINDPVLEKALVSVTEVRMSSDLKLATAYVTILGQTETKPFVDALNRNARFIRGRLTPALRQMKYMPEVRFRTDTSFDNFARIDALLKSPEVARDLDDEDDDKDNG